jgi:nitrate reductase NapAB chaperone NapD
MNVSSIVVRTAAENMNTVITEINSIDLCEVHFNDTQGKIVVTIEGESVHDQIELMKRIQDLPFVLNASLMYSYSDHG